MPTVSHVQEATFSASKKKPLLRETSATRRLDQQVHTGLLVSREDTEDVGGSATPRHLRCRIWHLRLEGGRV